MATEPQPTPAPLSPEEDEQTAKAAAPANQAERRPSVAPEELFVPPGFFLKSIQDALKITRQSPLEREEKAWGLFLFFLLGFLASLGVSGYALYAIFAHSWIWLLWLSLTGFIALLLYEMSIEVFCRRVITLTPDSLQVQFKSPPSFFSDRFFERQEIRRLYSKRVGPTGNYNYKLYLIDANDRHIPLIRTSSPFESLFLERVVAQFWDLPNEPPPDAFGPLFLEDQSRAFQEWQMLAEVYDLDFVNEGLRLTVSGRYRRLCWIKITAYPKAAWSDKMAMRLDIRPDDSTAAALTSLLDLTPADIEALFDRIGSFDLPGKLEVAPKGRHLTYTLDSPETDSSALESLLNNFCDLLATYPRIVVSGGQAVPALQRVARRQTHPFQAVAGQLLKEIAAETTARLRREAAHLYCVDCLTKCAGYPIQQPFHGAATYYGCRACRQSHDFFAAEQVIAVLDDRLGPEPVQQGQTLRVNWLARRELFDFDGVEIIHATDEEVERFAVQVGNDTDLLRRPRYRRMRCLTAADCQLSQNTQRILRRTFGG